MHAFMRGSLCPGLLQRGVWEAVSGMREAKSVEILQVDEVKGWMMGGREENNTGDPKCLGK